MVVLRIKEVIEKLASRLASIYGGSEAKNIALVLLEDKYNVDRSDLLFDKEVTLDGDLLEVDLERLLANEPVQYVTGFAHFYGRKFYVEKGALIPRPETEELVDLIVTESAGKQPSVLDIGSGSGCIAISLEQELKGVTNGIDVSDDALKISKLNAEQLGSSANFAKCDVLQEVPDFKDLDILVSNPPYIPNREKELMRKNVLDFEPREALFVHDSDPLIFYKQLAELGLQLLKTGGKLYFEIHENFGDEVKSMVQNFGYQEVLIHLDMQGKNRMLSALKM